MHSRECMVYIPVVQKHRECFHTTSWRPYWYSKTMKWWPCWLPKPFLWELNSFLMQILSFVPINLHRCWVGGVTLYLLLPQYLYALLPCMIQCLFWFQCFLRYCLDYTCKAECVVQFQKCVTSWNLQDTQVSVWLKACVHYKKISTTRLWILNILFNTRYLMFNNNTKNSRTSNILSTIFEIIFFHL